MSRVSSAMVVLVVLVAGMFLVAASAGASDCQLRGFEDGTYRGGYIDRGEQQVSIEFTLEANVVTAIRYRHLAHQNVDYLRSEDATVKRLVGQYTELIEYLIGKDIRGHVNDLHNPGDIVAEDKEDEELPWWQLERYAIDALSGATTRGSKVVSAIRDALNRGVYSYQ